MPLDVEPVDHDAIEPGDRQRLPRGVLVELRERRRPCEPRGHRAHHRGGLQLLAGLRQLAFDDQQLALEMDREIDRGQAHDELDVEHPFRAGRRQDRHAVAQVVERPCGDEPVEMRAEQPGGLHREERRDVFGDTKDRPVVRHRDQEREILDPVEPGYRFAVAGGKIGYAKVTVGHAPPFGLKPR